MAKGFLLSTMRPLAYLLFLALVSCSTGFRVPPELEERVKAYYELEMAKNWNATYEFRSSTFRHSVRKERYVETMMRDDSDWKLASYRITSSSSDEGKVKLEMVFKQIPPPSFLRMPATKKAEIGEFEFEDSSIWLLDGNVWYAYAPGTRAHLTLNAPLVSQ